MCISEFGVPILEGTLASFGGFNQRGVWEVVEA